MNLSQLFNIFFVGYIVYVIIRLIIAIILDHYRPRYTEEEIEQIKQDYPSPFIYMD